MAWKGLSGMDAARVVLGRGRHRHGWPIAAGPWNVTGAREPRRSRGRMQGQAFLLTFEGPAVRAIEKSESPSRAKPEVRAYDRAAQYQDERAATTRSSLGVSLRFYISGGYRRARKKGAEAPFSPNTRSDPEAPHQLLQPRSLLLEISTGPKGGLQVLDPLLVQRVDLRDVHVQRLDH